MAVYLDDGTLPPAVAEYLKGLVDNASGGGKEKTREEEFASGFFWQEAAIDRILADFKHVSSTFDMDVSYLNGWFSGQHNNMLDWIEKQLAKMADIDRAFGPRPVNTPDGLNVVDEPGGFRFGDLTQTPEGMQHIFDLARQWVSMYVPGFRDAVLFKAPSGGRRGGGRTRPTPAEIRAQFDLDQLSRLVNEMSQALVLEEASDARAIATAYVESIVSNPLQELDFETFARNKILSKPRAKLIYKNKPESMSEEQYLQPYVQAFQSIAGPGFGDQMAETASAGARLNAAPGAFAARMQRTSQVQSSTPFLSKLGQRLTNFSEVLR